MKNTVASTKLPWKKGGKMMKIEVRDIESGGFRDAVIDRVLLAVSPLLVRRIGAAFRELALKAPSYEEQGFCREMVAEWAAVDVAYSGLHDKKFGRSLDSEF